MKVVLCYRNNQGHYYEWLCIGAKLEILMAIKDSRPQVAALLVE